MFVFAIYITHEKNTTIKAQEQYIEAQTNSRYLGNTINLLSIMPNNTEKKILLTNDYNYYFTLHNYGLHLIIPYSNVYFDYPLLTKDINFNATKYNYISLKKINNYIVITDAN